LRFRYHQLESNSTMAIGIIVPGIYDPGTGNAWAPNLWGKDFHAFGEQLEQQRIMPIEIGSDRAASALAEQWIGVAWTSACSFRRGGVRYEAPARHWFWHSRFCCLSNRVWYSHSTASFPPTCSTT
jgi:hypothetical protein